MADNHPTVFTDADVESLHNKLVTLYGKLSPGEQAALDAVLARALRQDEQGADVQGLMLPIVPIPNPTPEALKAALTGAYGSTSLPKPLGSGGIGFEHP